MRRRGRDDRRRRADPHPRPRGMPRERGAQLHAHHDGGGLRADVPLPARHGEAGAAAVRMTTLRRVVEAPPLLAVLILDAVLRLVAAVFSRGFLTVDDHLVLVDSADRLASGIPFPPDYKRSILYPGSVALLMTGMRALGNTSPDIEMLVLRLAHAAGAVLGVYFAFRIVERVAGKDSAVLAGLLVATFFPLPVTSVHQFEEAVCQVPLLAGCWWLLKADDAQRGAGVWSFLSGAATMTTLVLRFPALPFVLSFAALALWRPAQRFRKSSFVLGLLAVFALQAASNAVLSGDPWYFFFETAGHRAGVGVGYPEGPPWKYIGTLVYIFLPPFSLPASYLGRPRPPVFVLKDRNAVGRDAAAVRAAPRSPNYLILYSDSVSADTRLLERALGARLAPVAAVEPSVGDELAHLINPRHNHATQAVVLSVFPLTATSR